MADVQRLDHSGRAKSERRFGAPASRTRTQIERVLGSGEHRYRVIDNWARRPRGWVFGKVAVAANGDLYVSDGYGNARIHVISAEGEYRFDCGGRGDGPSQFPNPHAVTIGPDGRVYVCDHSDRRIQIFALDGMCEGKWGGVHLPDEPRVRPRRHGLHRGAAAPLQHLVHSRRAHHRLGRGGLHLLRGPAADPDPPRRAPGSRHGDRTAPPRPRLAGQHRRR